MCPKQNVLEWTPIKGRIQQYMYTNVLTPVDKLIQTSLIRLNFSARYRFEPYVSMYDAMYVEISMLETRSSTNSNIEVLVLSQWT